MHFRSFFQLFSTFVQRRLILFAGTFSRPSSGLGPKPEQLELSKCFPLFIQ